MVFLIFVPGCNRRLPKASRPRIINLQSRAFWSVFYFETLGAEYNPMLTNEQGYNENQKKICF